MKENIKKKSAAYLGIAFSLPALIYMMVFIGYPMVQNFILSFKNVDVYTFARPENQSFVGLQNYTALFTDANSILPKAILNTVIFTVASIFFQFIIGFGLALLFNKKFPGCSFFRGVTMISWLLPVTVAGLLFKFMFQLNGGIVNQFLTSAHILNQPIEWLLNGKSAMIAIVTANIWIGIPFNMILISTGLTTIPKELYESASIDGANKFHLFTKITLPLLKPTIESVLILGFIYTFKVYDLIYVMTSGGPVNSTQVLSTYSYKLSFELFKYSKGAAVANILFVILFIISLIYLKYVYSEEEA